MADHVHTTMDFQGVDARYKQILIIVILINGIMFGIEYFAGHIGNSLALQADALDFLGDTATYTLSFIVIGMPVRVRSSAAFLKGLSLLAMGLWIMGMTVYRLMVEAQPEPFIMTSIGALAAVANIASVMFLYRYKDGDANIRSVWLCSRNDAIGNVFIIMAGFAVAYTGTRWPDLVVAIIMASLFSWSAFLILKQSVQEYRKNSIDEDCDHDH